MSAVHETQQCFPRDVTVCGVVMPAMEPRHDLCPGGQHLEGVIGGWGCPCACHREDA